MSIFFKDDPVFSLLQDILQANVLKIPDARIHPLGVIEKGLTGIPKFRTTLGTILAKASDIDINPIYLETKAMANISGEKTNGTDLNVGLEVLDGFLKGFGVSLPNFNTHFKDVDKISFSFENVKRIWLDNGILASELDNNKIEKNALTESFFGLFPSKLLVIDSVITSNDFSIHVEETINDKFNFNMSNINQELKDSGGQLNATSIGSRSLRFTGENPLPFAFTCIHLDLNKNGEVVRMPSYSKKIPNLMKGISEDIYKKETLSTHGEFIEIEFE